MNRSIEDENKAMKAALWYFGNSRGPNVAEELKDALPKRIWMKIDLKAIEATDGEID